MRSFLQMSGCGGNAAFNGRDLERVRGRNDHELAADNLGNQF